MEMDELKNAKILNYILGTLVLVLITFILNFGLDNKPQPKQIQKNTIQEIKIEKAEPDEDEKQNIILVNLNNHEKAALFLLPAEHCFLGWPRCFSGAGRFGGSLRRPHGNGLAVFSGPLWC